MCAAIETPPVISKQNVSLDRSPGSPVDQTKWLAFRSMVHGFRIPDVTKWQAVWSTWTSESRDLVHFF